MPQGLGQSVSGGGPDPLDSLLQAGQATGANAAPTSSTAQAMAGMDCIKNGICTMTGEKVGPSDEEKRAQAAKDKHGSRTLGGRTLPGTSGDPTGVRAKLVQLALAENARNVIAGKDKNDPRVNMYRRSVTGSDSLGQDWCAYFVSWLFNQVGHPIVDNNGDGRVSTIRDWGKKTGRFHSKGWDGVRPGDMVIYTGHIGLVTDINRDASGKVTGFKTVEGNTSDDKGNFDSRVNDKSRSASAGNIVGFVSAT